VKARAAHVGSRALSGTDSPRLDAETTLVIGYGNSLRSDDGVGPAVASAVARWQRPDVRALAVHQLTPELAADLAAVDRAIFVDASAGGRHEEIEIVSLTAQEPGAQADRRPANVDGHRGDPRALLALCQLAYGRRPRAWWVTVPAVCLDFGETLSSATAAGMADALEAVRVLVEGRELPGHEAARQAPPAVSGSAPCAEAQPLYE
jgi:hydrogenase maturation protease